MLTKTTNRKFYFGYHRTGIPNPFFHDLYSNSVQAEPQLSGIPL